MTKQEAISEMKNGKKITHTWFDRTEWMTIENGKLLLEDGVRCSLLEFFSYRTDESWDDGYSFYEC